MTRNITSVTAYIACTVLLSACAGAWWGTSVPAPTTFNESAGIAVSGVTAAARTVRTLCGNTLPGGPCVDSSLITTTERDRAKLILQQTLNDVNFARRIYETGDADTALGRLQLAQTALAEIEKLLRERSQ